MSRIRPLFLLLTAAICLGAAPAASAAPGELDPTFGSGGMVKVLAGNEDSYGADVAVQPDGKIVVVGYEKPGNAVVLRLLPNGSLDPSFGSGGKTTTVIPTGFSEFRAVVMQPDGKIVAAGAAKGAANSDFLIGRFNSDGSPDGSFGGGDGLEFVPVGPENDYAQAVTIAPDGRIAATGYEQLGMSGQALGVVVLRPSGTPDSGFGGDGSVSKETAQKFDRGVAITMFGDGKVLLGDANGAGGGDGLTLMKLLSDGEFDPGFGDGDGIVLTPIPVEGAMVDSGRINDFIVMGDGRIVASGNGSDYFGAPPSYHDKVVAVRYLPNGELDPSFAAGGIFTRRIESEATVQTVEPAQGGGFLLAGRYQSPSLDQQASLVLRLDRNGAPDPAFGAGGFVLRGDTAPFGEGIEEAAIDAQDRLVTIGTAYGPDNTSWASLTRYLGDPQPALPISAGGAAANKAPHARMRTVPKKVRAEKLKGFSGSASDPDGSGVRRVQIALVRRATKRGAGKARLVCFGLKSAKPRFKRVKREGKRCGQRWLTVKGTAKWSFKLKGPLPPGRYVVFARAVDGKGLAEAQFSRKRGNRLGFRVVASR